MPAVLGGGGNPCLPPPELPFLAAKPIIRIKSQRNPTKASWHVLAGTRRVHLGLGINGAWFCGLKAIMVERAK